MPTDQVEVTFNCQECGGTVLQLPDGYTNDSIAKCKSCGQEVGRWGDVKTDANKLLVKTIIDRFRDTLRGRAASTK